MLPATSRRSWTTERRLTARTSPQGGWPSLRRLTPSNGPGGEHGSLRQQRGCPWTTKSSARWRRQSRPWPRPWPPSLGPANSRALSGRRGGGRHRILAPHSAAWSWPRYSFGCRYRLGTASRPTVRGALCCHHALQHVEGRLVCLGETRGQRALQRGDAASVRGHLSVRAPT